MQVTQMMEEKFLNSCFHILAYLYFVNEESLLVATRS
jgi:hypothetical protein